MARDDELIEKYPHGRVFWKALTSFGVLLGAGALLKDYWKPIDDLRAYSYAHVYVLPLSFVAFYVMFILYEAVIRFTRLEMERRRSDPMEPRRRRGVKDEPELPFKNGG